MDGLMDFFAMGGYGAFVWPAFGATAAVMVGMLVATLRDLRANQRLLARIQATAPGGGARHRASPGTGAGRGARRDAAGPDGKAAAR